MSAGLDINCYKYPCIFTCKLLTFFNICKLQTALIMLDANFVVIDCRNYIRQLFPKKNEAHMVYNIS